MPADVYIHRPMLIAPAFQTNRNLQNNGTKTLSLRARILQHSPNNDVCILFLLSASTIISNNFLRSIFMDLWACLSVMVNWGRVETSSGELSVMRCGCLSESLQHDV